ncbi:MAG TPA: 2-oxoglutarate dehydrogenase complex dihydrolipoyllysine-residue succinyltransferase [Ktedonobacterales bacterium]
MPGEVTVPQLGESIVEATIGRWLKHEGETVAAGEALAELETDKVNLEVTAPESGVLQRILKGEGETVGVGETIAVVAAASAVSAANAAAPGQTTAPPEASPVPAPAANGQAVPSTTRATPIPPTSPATPALAAPAATVAAIPATTTVSAPAGPHAASAPEQTSPAGFATPVAWRMAHDRGIALESIHGTGAGGRVTQHDVAAYLAVQPAGQGDGQSGNGQLADGAGAATSPAAVNPAPAPVAPPATPPTTSPASRPEERVRLSRRRQTIARRLVETQHTAAMLTTFNEVDMSAIMELRKRRRDAFKERYGVGLGFMSFFTKAVIGALKAFPRLNAEIQGDTMVLKRYYDIGIAVSTDEGLVVPVVRDADRLTFAAIEREIARLAERARNRTLSLEDLQGGTFTITNGGVFGSLLSTPILNGPQVGILGMHKIQERPVAVAGQVVIHPMMYVAVSYDHRIVDGAEAVSFLVRIKELLEDPETLLLEG